MSSIKGKADLNRSGKNGTAKPVSLNRGTNAPSSLDNTGVFANSTPGLAKGAACQSPSPGSGRAGLDMYCAKGGGGRLGMDVAKAPPKKNSEF